MTKYIYLFYILLGVCLLAGFGSAFDSGQEHDVVRTVGLENSAVALCNISESNNGQEKKEINNESDKTSNDSISVFRYDRDNMFSEMSENYNKILLFLFAPCAPPKFCELIPLLPS